VWHCGGVFSKPAGYSISEAVDEYYNCSNRQLQQSAETIANQRTASIQSRRSEMAVLLEHSDVDAAAWQDRDPDSGPSAAHG